MSKKIHSLLGRNPKSPKLKNLASLAVARISMLKNHHHVRCSHARSDVVQLLNLGHQDRALLRVELVIRELKMLEVFAMVETYCHVLIEGFQLIENNRECPEELKEVISSLIFAASRCRELPELQEIRMILQSKYGNEFIARAIELKDNCGVNLEMIQKLSKRQASLETRENSLKQIAFSNGITLHLATAEEKQAINEKEEQLKPSGAVKLKDTEAGINVSKKGGLERSFSSSSSDTDSEDLYNVTLSEEIDHDQSDEEAGQNQNSMPWLKRLEQGSDKKSNLATKGDKPDCESRKWKPGNPEADLTTDCVEGRSGLGNTHCLRGEKRGFTRATAFKHR